MISGNVTNACLYEVMDGAQTSKGKSIDASGTCKNGLGAVKILVQEHVDQMDAMLFKSRDELYKEDVRTELSSVAPKYNEINTLNDELEGLLKTKSKALKRMENRADVGARTHDFVLLGKHTWHHRSLG